MAGTVVRIDDDAFLLISEGAYIVLTKNQMMTIWKFCEELLAKD